MRGLLLLRSLVLLGRMHLRLARRRRLIDHLSVLVCLSVHSRHSLLGLACLGLVTGRVLSWQTCVRLVTLLLILWHSGLRVLALGEYSFISKTRPLKLLLRLILGHPVHLLLPRLRLMLPVSIVTKRRSLWGLILVHFWSLRHLLLWITSKTWLLPVRRLIISHSTLIPAA